MWRKRIRQQACISVTRSPWHLTTTSYSGSHLAMFHIIDMETKTFIFLSLLSIIFLSKWGGVSWPSWYSKAYQCMNTSVCRFKPVDNCLTNWFCLINRHQSTGVLPMIYKKIFHMFTNTHTHVRTHMDYVILPMFYHIHHGHNNSAPILISHISSNPCCSRKICPWNIQVLSHNVSFKDWSHEAEGLSEIYTLIFLW